MALAERYGVSRGTFMALMAALEPVNVRVHEAQLASDTCGLGGGAGSTPYMSRSISSRAAA